MAFRDFIPKSDQKPEKLINPGFCTGPYLPIYGVGLCALYLLASLEKYNFFSSPLLSKIVLFLAMAVGMTFLRLGKKPRAMHVEGKIALA